MPGRDLVVQLLVDGRRRERALGLAGLGRPVRGCPAMILRQHSWPNSMASSTSASVASLAPGLHHHDAGLGAGHHDVELGIAGSRHRWDWRSASRPPARRAPRPALRVKGMSEMASAAAAPTMASGSGSRSGSADSTMPMICVSQAEALREQRADRPVDQPAGQDLFFGGTAFALDEAAGESSRRRKCIRGSPPSAGKSVAPGFGSGAAQAVTSTTESPQRTTTAPFACLATLPVSRVIWQTAQVNFSGM